MFSASGDVTCREPITTSEKQGRDFRLTSSDGFASRGLFTNQQSAWRSDQPLYLESNETHPDHAWIQIEFRSVHYVSGIETRGDPEQDEWVTSFCVMYSPHDCLYLDTVTDQINNQSIMVTFDLIRRPSSFRVQLVVTWLLQVFHSNVDRSSSVHNVFASILPVKCLRVVPLTSASSTGRGAAMRLHLLGCGKQNRIATQCRPQALLILYLQMCIGYSKIKLWTRHEPLKKKFI